MKKAVKVGCVVLALLAGVLCSVGNGSAGDGQVSYLALRGVNVVDVVEGSVWPGSVVVTNEKQAREAVRKAVGYKVDFIKVYVKLSREAYFAIADQCNQMKVCFAGHVPYAVLTGEASDAGQRSIEHLHDMVRGCSRDEANIRQELLKGKQITDELLARGLDTYDGEKAGELYRTVLENETWLCPTLTLYRGRFLCHKESVFADERLDYIPVFLRNSWKSKCSKLPWSQSDERQASAQRTYDGCLKSVRRLKEAGLEHLILAGTDTGNPYCFPGFSLHDELELLVRSGFTPAQALRASTCNAARFLGRSDSMGTIEKGKLADLVLLKANPLEDIANTRKIGGVIFKGKLFSEAELQEMLKRIASIP